ncbi:hypothetical protein Taro_049648 [Colocasia esculenta]|uniref:Uncharacterized protein n=1 Tax=Colocasia esculenta TaxID=4460 RepID=A0A843XBP2_COLES|nr:hypothetical protein [Colocasia esculenta]
MVVVFARAAVGFVLGLCVPVGVSRRLREPACGVAFTGAGLLPEDPVEGSCLVGCPLVVGVSPCWMSPCVEVCVVCLALCACAPLCTMLCSVGIFARAKQMLVCRVAPLVERCDTWLLRCIAWLPYVLVRFSRTIDCCLGEVRSQDYSGLLSAGCCATSGLRGWLYAFFLCFPWVARGGGVGRAVGAMFSHCGDLCGEGSSPCAVLRLSRLFPRARGFLVVR